jgi:hypothetical protein
MKLLSAQLLEKKRQKLAPKIRAYVERSLSLTPQPFGAFKHRPNVDEAVEMFMSARFGPGDPLSSGPDMFAYEYILDELCNVIEDTRGRPSDHLVIIDPTSHDIRIISSQSEHWGNLLFDFMVDEKLYDYWSRMTTDDFAFINANNFGYAVERESRAFGFLATMTPLMKTADALESFGEGRGFQPVWRPSPWKANDKCTVYHVTVGPIDRLLTPEERALHGVTSFDRRLPSGKITRVQAHHRRNPLKLRDKTLNADEIRHVVYRVYDADEVLRYIGEGSTTRPDHVNSGCSHNYKLNEHFFRRGPMRVELVAQDLSKDEAYSVERLLIRAHQGPSLWNIKDYEPLTATC